MSTEVHHVTAEECLEAFHRNLAEARLTVGEFLWLKEGGVCHITCASFFDEFGNHRGAALRAADTCLFLLGGVEGLDYHGPRTPPKGFE